MAIPNYIDAIHRLAAEHPQEWREAHTNGPNTEAFIRRLAWTLHQMDPRCGLNGKRGNPDDISDDVIAIKGEGSAVDVVNGGPMEIIDVISGAGGPNPQPAWIVGPGGPGDKGAWVQPQPVGGGVIEPPPPPPPPPVCQFQSTDLAPVLGKLDSIIQVLVNQALAVDQLKAQVRGVDDRAAAAAASADAARAQAADVREALRNGLAITGDGTARAGFLGVVSGKVTGVAKG